MNPLLARLPEGVRQALRATNQFVSVLPYYGTSRWCPVCGGTFRKFVPHGSIPREEARCVGCGALERHRLLWLWLQRMTNFFDGRPKHVLHVAPESFLEGRFRRVVGSGYITADLYNPSATVKMDITDIQYPDESFDVIFCSHVLEHVPDDRRAMRELRRVLKRDGWAVIMVPITADHTYEDPSITDAAGRLRVYGQADHVRRYGPDFVDRLREAGFTVEVLTADRMLDRNEVIRLGLALSRAEIYSCTRGDLHVG